MPDPSAPPPAVPEPRPLTRAQALENRAFLAALRRTGNAREAARAIGQHRAKFTRRRLKHPAFAQAWDAALVLADAALKQHVPERQAAAEPRVTRTRTGRLQLRRALPDRIDRAAEQRFLLALSACANVSLAAAAAGFSRHSFYLRRRRNPAFAREMRAALAQGYERVEAALLHATVPLSFEDDAWRHNEPPAMPPMTVDQAMQLLWHHQREARLLAEPGTIRRRRGESGFVWGHRLAAMAAVRTQADRDAFAIAQAARAAGDERSPFEVHVVLPDWGAAANGVSRRPTRVPPLSSVAPHPPATGNPPDRDRNS